MKKLIEVKKLFIYFISFAFIGWIYELILFLIEDHILVNRGYFYGPWLPIYGFGGLIIYSLFYRFKDRQIKIKNINIRPLVLIIYISLVAVTVELISTYICDVIGVNWQSLWTYADDFMNFQGRIALLPGLKFGIIGVLAIYFIIPLIDKVKESNNKIVNIIVYIVICIFLLDVIIHIFTGSTYNGPV